MGFLKEISETVNARPRESYVERISLSAEISPRRTGPALASAGPDWKQFCGTHSVVGTETFEEHQVIMIEIDDVKEEIRKERHTASLLQ